MLEEQTSRAYCNLCFLQRALAGAQQIDDFEDPENEREFRNDFLSSGEVVGSPIYTVCPKQGKILNACTLLSHVRGAKIFEDVRRVDRELFSTF